MFFGIGLPELLVLSMIGLIVFGPERLPDMAAKLASGVKSLRAMARKAMTELNVESGAVAKTLSDLQSLTPRAVVGDLVASVVDDSAQTRVAPQRGTNAYPSTRSIPLLAEFDPDAT